jgi:predicted DNA-binding protein (MmcQ/YjbR family)
VALFSYWFFALRAHRHLLSLSSGQNAQPRPLPVKSTAEIQAIKERSEAWLKTCLEDWDAATHMSKNEWRTVCRRVTVERENFLITNTDAFIMKNSEARPKVKN